MMRLSVIGTDKLVVSGLQSQVSLIQIYGEFNIVLVE